MQKVIDIIKKQKDKIDTDLGTEIDEERWGTLKELKDSFLDEFKEGLQDVVNYYNTKRETDAFPMAGEYDFQVRDKKDLKGQNERIIAMELKGEQEFESYPVLSCTFTTKITGEPFIRVDGHRLYMDDNLGAIPYPEGWDVEESVIENAGGTGTEPVLRKDIGHLSFDFADEKELAEKREELTMKVWKSIAIFLKLYDKDLLSFKVAEWTKLYGFTMEKTLDDFLELGNMAMIESDFDSAIYYFDEMLAKQPENEEALIGKAMAVDASGLPQDAIPYYEQVISLNDENEIAHCQRGILLGRIGDYKEGIKAIEKALKLNPKYKAAKSAKLELIRAGEEKGIDMGKYKKPGKGSMFDDIM